MTRLRIASDLHNEFGPLRLSAEPACDVLVLAGDVNLGAAAMEDAADYGDELDAPVIVVAGNHEHYNREISKNLVTLSAASNAAVRFLENASAVVAGVRFLGCTLWTDYALTGDPMAARLVCVRAMNDHRLIRFGADRWHPAHAATAHAASVSWLRRRLDEPFAGPTVVVTHHAPTRRSISGRYVDAMINAAYASNLDDLVEASSAALWVHGHTHHSADYRIGWTRVVCNPRGYAPNDLNAGFDPDLVVEI